LLFYYFFDTTFLDGFVPSRDVSMFAYVIFPLLISTCFYMIFCSFLHHFVHDDGFQFSMGHEFFFFFFLKVVSDICLVVFCVLVIFICFSYRDSVSCSFIIYLFFMKKVN